ncbi:MAG: hypothetical protein AAFU64_05680 [Bacteroidota bacterium]
MKNHSLLFLLCFLFVSPQLWAQKTMVFSEALPASQKVKLDLEYASNITINIYDGQEVKLSVSASLNDNEDNDNYEIEAKKEGDYLLFESRIKDLKKISKKRVALSGDNQGGHHWNRRVYWDDDHEVHIVNGNYLTLDVNYEISLPAQASLIIETVTGEIEMTSPPKGLEIKSVTGDIDLSVGEGAAHSFKVKTITGDVYTNLKLNYKEKDGKGLKRVGGGFSTRLEADLNGGGNAFVLESTTGNIYLRKQE